MPDFRLPTGYLAKGWKSHDQVAVLQDGRVIAYGVNWVQTTYTNACHVLNVCVPDLRKIEYVLQVQFTEDPINCAAGNGNPPYGVLQAKNKKITGNVVGMTLTGVTYSTGTTLLVEVIAIGPP